MTEPRFANILFCEDDPDDIRLTEIALRESRFLNRLTIVRDGEEALRCLHQREEYADAAEPDLVLLDLHLPRIDGWHVLAEMREDPRLRKIPVVVLTSSDVGEEVTRAYEAGANSVIGKPVNVAGLMGIVRQLDDYWLGLVVLPTRVDDT